MAAGKPVIAIAPDDSEIARVVYEENCGMVVAPGDIDSLVREILHLRNHETLRVEMGTRGRKAFELKYSSSLASNRYQKILESMQDQ